MNRPIPALRSSRLRAMPVTGLTLALLALVLYPFAWLLLIPFKLVGIAVGGILAFVKGLIFLPARLLGGPRPA